MKRLAARLIRKVMGPNEEAWGAKLAEVISNPRDLRDYLWRFSACFGVGALACSYFWPIVGEAQAARACAWFLLALLLRPRRNL